MSVVPPRRLVLEFTKMTGAGNDFIVIDNRFYRFGPEELSNLAQKYCPRKTAVGADGLLALEDCERDELDFRMVYYNADGSRGSMCGNGARCLSRFARMTGISNNPIRFQADAGEYLAEVPDDELAEVILHLPPFKDYRPDPILGAPVDMDVLDISFIWTGTEHIVVTVDNVESFPVTEIGSILRNDLAVSESGANVNFVQVVDNDKDGTQRLRVRTYERGVESETMACGTGAVASAMVSLQKRDAGVNQVEVVMNGGVLRVQFEGALAHPDKIFLEGPADVVYRGTLEI